tara:strand:- start:1742 stop:2899 length:1158 start_codon:yes stop_codon:yes gene_type:complete
MRNIILKTYLFASVFAVSISAQSIVPTPPELNLSSYILMDAITGKVLAESNSNSQIEPASMTKVMSGYIVADQIDQGMILSNDNVLISRKAWKMEGSRMFIEVGKQVSVEDLLKGLVIQSGNDAAVALAEYIAGSEQVFVDVMNEYASVLGLRNTLFQNSTGLPDADHFTSVRDLAVLSRALIDNFPSHYDLYKEKEYTFNNIRQLNRNKLLWRDESVDGIKTGHTEAAGYCLIASAKRNDMRLISVVAGSKSDKERFDASRRLLEYGFRFYASQKLLEANKELKSSTVWGGKRESVPIGLENDLIVTLPKGDFRNLTINYTIQSNIQAPIKAGDELGLVEVISNNNIVVSESLIALEDIDEKGFFGRMIAKIILWFIGLFNFND